MQEEVIFPLITGAGDFNRAPVKRSIFFKKHFSIREFSFSE